MGGVVLVLKKSLLIGAVFILALLAAFPARAATTKEDPAASAMQYSGLSLLVYYSSSLDQVLAADPLGAAGLLGKMP